MMITTTMLTTANVPATALLLLKNLSHGLSIRPKEVNTIIPL